jgi:hypothetical protein
MNTPYPREVSIDAIVDVFAEADPGLRNHAVKREVVRRADALLREFEAEMEALHTQHQRLAPTR